MHIICVRLHTDRMVDKHPTENVKTGTNPHYGIISGNVGHFPSWTLPRRTISLPT